MNERRKRKNVLVSFVYSFGSNLQLVVHSKHVLPSPVLARLRFSEKVDELGGGDDTPETGRVALDV
jgi:hypothetical protein